LDWLDERHSRRDRNDIDGDNGSDSSDISRQVLQCGKAPWRAKMSRMSRVFPDKPMFLIAIFEMHRKWSETNSATIDRTEPFRRS
jgi:hypothetical protein